MEIGELRHRVDIQARDSAQNDLGEPLQAWTTVATVWAAVKPVGGRGFYAAQALRSEVPVRILMRHNTSVTPAHRIRHGTHIYEIEAVQHWPRDGMTVLMCREVVL